MKPSGDPGREPDEHASGTLGELLYANRTKKPVPESEWAGLVRSMAAGDQLALRTLYEQTRRIVFTLIMRIVNDREAAEELTVDVFYDVWRRAATYDAAGGPVVGWILNQARSRAIDRLRFEQRKKRVAPAADDHPAAAGYGRPDQVLDVREQGRLLRDAMSVLTPAERQAIETAFFSELTYYDVATRFNEPVGTVKTRIRSGLGKLRRALADRMSGHER